VEGGVEKHVFRISEELTSRGHEVDVYTCAGSGGRDHLAKQARVGRVLVRRYDPIFAMGEFGAFWPGFAPKILESKYDIVHSHSFRHPHTDLSAMAGRTRRSRCVLTGHSPFHPQGVRSPLARGLTPVYDGLMAPFTLRAFDRIIAVTESEAKSMVELGAPARRVAVIPNGVEDENFAHPPSTDFLSRHGLEGKRLVLYLGRINKTKGIDILLNAFKKVALAIPDAALVIAGPASSTQELEYQGALYSLASGLGIRSNVIFTGRLSSEDKQVALESCSLLVLPSLYEPFGIVLLEAMAHSKPVVSASTDGPSSIITPGSNGVLVRPGDHAELGDAIIRLLGDEALTRQIGRSARETAEGYRWARVVDRIEALYEEIQA
jgi:glycosyltransferase involved in cell wall biosynthesis